MVLAVHGFTLTDELGNAVSGATVTVKLEEPGAPIAPIYEDRAGLTPKTNPFTTDVDGSVWFYAPGGAYQIEIKKGTDTIAIRHVAVGTAAERDADDFGQLMPGLRWRELVDITNNDLDSLLVSGFYRGNTLTNSPDGGSNEWTVQVLTNQADADEAVQIAWKSSSSTVQFIRARVGGIWGSWTGVPNTAAVNSWTQQQYFPIATLTDGTNIPWDLDGAQVAKVTITADRTLSNPTNAKEGAVYVLVVIQDGTGGWTLGYNTEYEWPDDTAPDTGEAAANQRTILTFIREGGKMRGISAANYPA